MLFSADPSSTLATEKRILPADCHVQIFASKSSELFVLASQYFLNNTP